MDHDVRAYRSDDPTGLDETYPVLAIQIAGGDYFLSVAEDTEPFPKLVRIRTSGSNDTRNLKVLKAMKQLWEALADDGNGWDWKARLDAARETRRQDASDL